MALKAEALAATKLAKVLGTPASHLAAAALHAEYCDFLIKRMSARGQGYSRTLGYHSDLEDYHRAVAKGSKSARPPRPYNPRNDPASMSFRGGTYYD